MNEPIKLIGCFVLAVGWVALPPSLLCWSKTEHSKVTWIIKVLVALEIAYFTWLLYCKF